MGRKPTEREQQEFIEFLRCGRDEMNLLEHSISSADSKVDKTTRSIVFRRADHDPESGKPLNRSWKITFDSEHGRPTPKDDDVFMACMRLSAANNFTDPMVEFTRFQMCRILQWAPDGRNYAAIDDAFKRMKGITIEAKKYFWDNASKRWVTRLFGVIDDVWLYELEEDEDETPLGGARAPRSWFRWSQVMQESFDAGYLRQLDMEVYNSLSNPIARKLYRYLGKNFWHRTSHRVDLQTLCHEKLGYSQTEKRNGRLRQKIAKAIRELESRGIYGLSHEFNASYGKCEVVFNAKATTKNAAKTEVKKRELVNPLVERLLKFGVDRTTAIDAVKRFDEERIVTDLEHVEFETKAGRVKSSKAGMLARMLKSDEPWGRPQGFQSSAEAKRKRERLEIERQAKIEAEAKRVASEKQQAEADLAAFNQFMGAMTAAAREAFSEEALRHPFWGKRYRSGKREGDSSKMAATLQAALESLWRSRREEEELGARKQVRVQKSIPF